MVSGELVGRRLDGVVRILFELSWNRARDWIRRGKVFVDGQVQSDEGFEISDGALIELRLDAVRPRDKDEINKSHIVYVDSHVVVVRKPCGVLSVPFEGTERNTLDAQVRRLLSRISTKTKGPKRSVHSTLFVVHRLDRNTSGLMVFARTTLARERLSVQFREHSILRRYITVVHGLLESQTIRSHLVVDRGDGRRGSSEVAPSPSVRRAQKGKLSITHVTVLEHLNGSTLVECRLETGRTNQIRIHLSEAGHPIIGETTYMRGYNGPEIPADRLMLHAAELGFVHPVSGELLRFEEPLSPEMSNLIEKLRLPSQQPENAQ